MPDLTNVGATPTARRRTRSRTRRRTAGGNGLTGGVRTGAGTGIGATVGGGGTDINLQGLNTEQRKLWDRAYQMGVRHGCEFSGNTRTNR